MDHKLLSYGRAINAKLISQSEIFVLTARSAASVLGRGLRQQIERLAQRLEETFQERQKLESEFPALYPKTAADWSIVLEPFLKKRGLRPKEWTVRNHFSDIKHLQVELVLSSKKHESVKITIPLVGEQLANCERQNALGAEAAALRAEQSRLCKLKDRVYDEVAAVVDDRLAQAFFAGLDKKTLARLQRLAAGKEETAG
jgi:ribosome-associated translation inhibitor RaiA